MNNIYVFIEDLVENIDISIIEDFEDIATQVMINPTMDTTNIYTKEMMDKVKKVYISGDIEDILKHLNDNPILKKYNIVINNNYELDYLTALNLKEKLSGLENIKISVDGNKKPISVDKYYESSVELNRIINRINSYGFTPFEKLMYIYNYVGFGYRTDFMDDDEKSYYPMDVSEAIKKHKSKFFITPKIINILLKKAGFNSMICNYTVDDYHKYDRNMVFLNDTEYNICGIYFLDSIAEMCASTTYSFFALTKAEMEDTDEFYPKKNETLKAGSLQMYSLIHSMKDEDARNTVLRLSLLVDDDDKLILSYSLGKITKRELMERIRKYEILLNRPIPKELVLKSNLSIDKKTGVYSKASIKCNEVLKSELGIKSKIKIK